MVILLTSLKRGTVMSSVNLREGQNLWQEIRNGQCRETRRGERSTVCWESISVTFLMGDARVGPEYGSLRPYGSL